MRKATKHIFLPLLLVAVMVIGLTGCGESFDAARYVKGCLDASTKGVFEDYIATTNQTEEEAKKEYEEKLDSELASLTGAFEMTDEDKESWRNLFKTIYGKYKYEVGEATKGDNMTFTVPVKTYRLTIFKAAMEETQKKAEDEMEKMVKKNASSLSTSDVSKMYLDYLSEAITAKLENPEYGEEQTVNVTIKINNSTNEYEIDDASVTALFGALDDISDMQ